MKKILIGIFLIATIFAINAKNNSPTLYQNGVGLFYYKQQI